MYPHSYRRSAPARSVAISVTKEEVGAALPKALFITFNLVASVALATAIGFLLV